MKPVNLNQLLFHPKSDSLSFFLPPAGRREVEVAAFCDEVARSLAAEGHDGLRLLFEKHRGKVAKIFRGHPDRSHGFFLSDELQGYVILQDTLEAYHFVGQTFHVRPLLEELFANPEFLLINVSLYDIKIYRGDFQHLEVIQQYEFDQLPENFVAAGNRLYLPQHLGLVPYKTILALKTIAQKVKDQILYESLPVIVTGLDDMKEIFIRYFADVSGVFAHFEHDFYEKPCMEILEKCREFRYAVTDHYSAQLRERLRRLMKSRRLLSRLEEIVPAVCAGRVGNLVIPSEKKLWGRVDLETGEFTVHKKLGKTSSDILNELAEEVIRQGGRIQILGPHFFPHDTSVLAVVKGQL